MKINSFLVLKQLLVNQDPKLEVEVVDDTPEVDQRPPKQETAEQPVDDETVDKEISDTAKELVNV